MEDIKSEIAEFIEPILTREGFELVALKLARYGRSSRLQLFIDTLEGDGVTIDDCAAVSRLVDEGIERRDFFEGTYTLEVSSPGIDRPLQTEKDFRRKIGRTIQVDFVDPKRRTVRGTVEDVADGAVRLTVKNGSETVTLDEIKLAREFI